MEGSTDTLKIAPSGKVFISFKLNCEFLVLLSLCFTERELVQLVLKLSFTHIHLTFAKSKYHCIIDVYTFFLLSCHIVRFFEKRASCLRSHSSKWSGSFYINSKLQALDWMESLVLLTKMLCDLAFCQPQTGICLFFIYLIIKKKILAMFFKISGEVPGLSYNRF